MCNIHNPHPIPNDFEAVDMDPDTDDRAHSKWIINDSADGVFDADIVTVWTCGQPK